MSYRNTEVLQVKGQYGNGEGGEALTYLRLGSDFQKDEGAIFERGICSPVCDDNVQKCPNILLKSRGVSTVRFLKYVWQFFNIIHKRVYAISLTDVDVEFHRPVHTHGSFILNCSSGNYLFQKKTLSTTGTEIASLLCLLDAQQTFFRVWAYLGLF